VLTCIRVGKKQKKIDISIPKLDHFIHRVYIHVARKVYSNIYLFERGRSDLSTQKYKRELEIMTQECILTAIRESIPTESIIRAYLDESIEEEEEIIIEAVPDEEDKEKGGEKEKATDEEKEIIEIPKEDLPATLSVENIDNETAVTRLTFNDVDEASDGTSIAAPKTIERLEEISEKANQMRKADEIDDEEPSGNVKIHMDEDVNLDGVFDLDKSVADLDLVSLDGVEDI